MKATPKSKSSLDSKTPTNKGQQMFPSKKSAASYLHNDVSVTAQVKTTKRAVEEADDNEELKLPSIDQPTRSNARKAVKFDNPQKGGTESVTENVKKVEKSKSSQEIQFIINCLKQHFVFYNLSMKELENIVQRMFYCEVASSEYIFKQGDDASSFFILAKGKVEVLIHDQVRREMGSGEGFGELALMYNAPRSASIRAVDNCGLWGIERASFKKALEEMITKEYEENRMFINGVKFFNNMTEEQKDSIAGALITQKFNKGENIVNEGDPASSFYIIKDGTVVVLKDGKEIRKMVKGDSFGEQALFYNTVRTATVKAINNNVKCLALGRDTLTEALGNHVQVITLRNQQIWALEKSSVLSQLTKLQHEKVADSMKIVNHKKGEVIFKAGDVVSTKFLVLHEGILKESKKGKVVGAKNTILGESNIIELSSKLRYEDDVVAETDCTTSEITIETFFSVLGASKFQDVLKKNERSHEKKSTVQIPEIKKVADKIKLEELIYFKKLGAGQFGNVYLVREKNHDDFMALKCVSKQQVVESQLEKHMQQEKLVMETINFPFIVAYIRSYKDDNFVYFLEQFIKGLELFDVIREIGILDTPQSQFYIGSLILAIEHLHAQNIIYRDLKPENVMIDHHGYVKMIDLGTAKFLKSKTQRTFTTIGTPHYMAPEVITGKGYTLLADLWSIGICLFEFMCGSLPFGESSEDPQEVCEEILTKAVKFTSYCRDKNAKRFMNQLINRVPEVRLGSSYAALKAHPWFENFDWDKLVDKELPSPYVPPPKKLISEEDINKMVKLNKKVIDEIKEEQKAAKKYRKEQASDPNWDKGF